MTSDTTNQLRIGYLSTVYHTSFLLQATDILKHQDIQPEWTLFPSGPDMIAAMEGAQLDLGYIGLPPAIIGIDRGADLRCIAGGHIEGTVLIGGDQIVPFNQCSDMDEFLAQLTAIGSPPRGSIHDVIVSSLIKKYGMEDRIRIIHYPWADFIPDALLRGEIQAGAGTPALAVTARRYANAKIIMPPENLWPYNPSYGIIASGEMDEGPLLSRFLMAHEGASEMIRHDPVGSAQKVSLVTGMHDPAFIQEAYRISPKYCASLPPAYIASTMAFVEVLFDTGYIQNPLSKHEIFDTTLIDEIHPLSPHYDEGIVSLL